MIAVYAGTFDPLTTGHIAVIRRAVRLFDHLRVVIAVNPAKTPVFDVDERLALIRSAVANMPTVSVGATEQLIVEYAVEIGAQILVRGVRDGNDAESETRMAQINCRLAPQIETVMLAATPGLERVSSSALKEKLLRGEDISVYCHPEVEAQVADRLRQGGAHE